MSSSSSSSSSTPITEVVIFPLKSGQNKIHDAGSHEGGVVKEALTKVRAQEGCENVFYGIERENEDTMWWFVEWKSLEYHKKFGQAAEHAPFLTSLSTILSGRPTVYDATITPHPSTSILSGAPLTEIVHFFVDPSAADSAKSNSNLTEFMKVMTSVDCNQDPAHFTGHGGGWTVQSVDKQSIAREREGKEGQMLKAYVCLAGWGSYEDHMKSSGTKEVSEAMPLLFGLEGASGICAVHVKFRLFEG